MCLRESGRSGWEAVHLGSWSRATAVRLRHGPAGQSHEQPGSGGELPRGERPAGGSHTWKHANILLFTVISHLILNTVLLQVQESLLIWCCCGIKCDYHHPQGRKHVSSEHPGADHDSAPARAANWRGQESRQSCEDAPESTSRLSGWNKPNLKHLDSPARQDGGGGGGGRAEQASVQTQFQTFVTARFGPESWWLQQQQQRIRLHPAASRLHLPSEPRPCLQGDGGQAGGKRRREETGSEGEREEGQAETQLHLLVPQDRGRSGEKRLRRPAGQQHLLVRDELDGDWLWLPPFPAEPGHGAEAHPAVSDSTRRLPGGETPNKPPLALHESCKMIQKTTTVVQMFVHVVKPNHYNKYEVNIRSQRLNSPNTLQVKEKWEVALNTGVSLYTWSVCGATLADQYEHWEGTTSSDHLE